MIEVRPSATVARPAAELFDFVSDMANNPRWQSGMQTCEWTSPPPVGVGSTYDQVARFLGREIRTTFEVTAHEPGRLITIESRSGPLDLVITRTVAAVDDDTSRVDAVIQGTPRGPMRLLEPLLRGKVERDITADYRRLTELLE